MKTCFSIILLAFSIKLSAYDACKSVTKLTCNQENIQTIEKDLKKGLAGNSDLFLKELIKLKLIEKYELYLQNFVNPVINHKEEFTKKEFKTVLENHKTHLETMRLSLALRKPSTREYEFSFRQKDMFETEIEHFSYIDGKEIAPLSEDEKLMATAIFKDLHASYYKENKVPEKMNSIIDAAKRTDADKAVLRMNNEIFWGVYLDSIIEKPVLRHISVTVGDLDEKSLVAAYKDLAKEIEKKKELVFNLADDMLEQLYFHDSFMNEILQENTFFCESAEMLRADQTWDRKKKEYIYGFAGLALCPFTLVGCSGAVFGGSVANFMNEKERLETSLTLSVGSDTLNRKELTEKTKSVGSSALMVLLSAPTSIIGKIGLKKVGFETVAHNVKAYAKAVKKEGWKRAFIKEPTNSSSVFKFVFKQMKKKPDAHDYIDYVIQAPIIGISKLVSKKAYTFQPGEFAVGQLQKLLQKFALKKSMELTGPIHYLGNLVDFRLVLTGYAYGINAGMDYIESNSKMIDYAKANFLSTDEDARFEILRQAEISCKNSVACSSNIDELMKVYSNLIVNGDFKLQKKEIELEKKGFSKDKIIEEILKDKDLIEYMPYIFPNFSQNFPDFDSEKEISKKHIQTMAFELIKINVARDIKRGGIEKILNEDEDAPNDLVFFLNHSQRARKLVSQPLTPKVLSEISDELNLWVQINHQELLK